MPSTHDGEYSSGGRGRRWRKGFLALIGSVAVVASALPATTQAMAAPNAQVTAEPAGVAFTLEGRRNDGSITLPNGSGQYVCWSLTRPVTVPDRRQRIVGFTGLPSRLVSPGTTLLVPCRLTTSAGQAVRVGVRADVRAVTTRGSVDPVVVHRSPCGRVSITVSGIPVKVWVTLAAPAIGRYAELFRTRTYRVP